MIKFLVKSGKMNAKIQNMITAVYSNNSMSHSTLYKWIGQFRVGCKVVTDDLCKGRPVTAHSKEMVASVWNTIKENHHKMLRDVASSVGTSHETIRSILHEDLNMRKVLPHMVPKVLIDDQKVEHIRICCNWLLVDESKDIFSGIVTGDKSWIFEYNLTKKKNGYGLAYVRWAACWESSNRKWRWWWRCSLNVEGW